MKYLLIVAALLAVGVAFAADPDETVDQTVGLTVSEVHMISIANADGHLFTVTAPEFSGDAPVVSAPVADLYSYLQYTNVPSAESVESTVSVATPAVLYGLKLDCVVDSQATAAWPAGGGEVGTAATVEDIEGGGDVVSGVTGGFTGIGDTDGVKYNYLLSLDEGDFDQINAAMGEATVTFTLAEL